MRSPSLLDDRTVNLSSLYSRLTTAKLTKYARQGVEGGPPHGTALREHKVRHRLGFVVRSCALFLLPPFTLTQSILHKREYREMCNPVPPLTRPSLQTPQNHVFLYASLSFRRPHLVTPSCID